MVELALHTKENAPDGSRETLGAVEEKFGFTPNVLRQMAAAPATLGGTVQLMNNLEQSSLSVAEQWIALLTVALQNTANYCVAANSTVARMLDVPGDVIEGVRRDAPLADPRYQALRLLAGEMVRDRGQVAAATVRRFFDAGFTKGQLLEVILAVGLETMASYTASILETPVDEQYQDNIWTRPEPAAVAAG